MLGFAAIGLYLFYFAYRYNMLYVTNADIDTQGKAYVQALKHLTVGCYLLMVCLIGLFAIGTAANTIALGPLILLIILLIVCILYHVALNSALEPLINYLPKNLEAEEEALLSREETKLSHPGEASDEALAGGSGARDSGVANVDSAEKGLTVTDTPTEKPNFLLRYLRPDKYDGYVQMRRLVPSAQETATYSPEVERDAYFPPSIKAQPPLLWIPRDELGVSRQEIKHTSRVIEITDEDAWLDEKNNICWDQDKGVPPIFSEKIYY